MTNWKRVAVVITVAIIATIVGLLVWNYMIEIQRQNCINNIDSIKNNPDGLVAQGCMRVGIYPDYPDQIVP